MTKPSSPASSETAERFEIEVFRPGTFKPMAGDPIAFSGEDLSAITASYDADAHPAPIVVGHPTTDAPAFGWIEEIRYDGESERLIATVGDVEPAFAEAVRARRYRKVSIALFSPTAPANPKPGSYYPKHLGFLGAAAPAVPGLKPVNFAGSAEKTLEIEFAAPGVDETASLFRRLHDFLIDQFGMEQADRVLPTYEIDWLERAGEEPSRAYAEPAASPDPTEEPSVSKDKPDEVAFAEREAELNRREAALKKREGDRLHDDHVAFADELIEEGRLLPVKKTEAVALLDAIAAESRISDLSFALDDGRTTTSPALETLKSLMKAAPVVVDYGRQDMGDAPGADVTAAFAADGLSLDSDQLELHEKALAYQAAHSGTDYLAAVQAVSKGERRKRRASHFTTSPIRTR